MFGWEVWAVLLVIILVFEALALFSGKPGDTLSESVWWLRTRIWGRIVLFPLWAWLSWHFFLEPVMWNPQSGVWVDDFIVVGVGVGLALIRDYDDYHKSPAELPELEG